MNGNPVNPGEIKILVDDDDESVAHGTAHLLQRARYVTATASNGVDALTAMQTFNPHLLRCLKVCSNVVSLHRDCSLANRRSTRKAFGRNYFCFPP